MSTQSVALPNLIEACTRKFILSVANVILPTLLWTLFIDDNGITAGILQQIQEALQIGDAKASFIQINYIISYVFFSLFLVRLQNHRILLRRWIGLMAITVIIWIISVPISINVKSFFSFLLMGFSAGLGEATCSTIAFTIIGLHFRNTPTKYLFPFFITIPLSSGLSLAVSSKVANYSGSWQSGYQVTAIFWAIIKTTLLLCLTFIQNTFVQHPSLDEREDEDTSHILFLWDNIKQITKKKSFLMMIVLHFFAGPLNYWGPKLISLGLANQKNDQSISLDSISFVLGMVVMIASVIGAFPHYFIIPCPSPRVTLVSMFLSALFAIVVVILSGVNTNWCLVNFFLCFAFISFTAACVAKQMCTDFQTTKLTMKAYYLFLPLLGKVVSNLLIGLISEYSQGDHFLLSNVSALNSWSPDTTNSTMINDATFNFTNVISLTNTFGDESNSLQLAMIITFSAMAIILVLFFVIHIFKRDSRIQENVELGVAVANHCQIIELFFAGVRHYWAYIRPNAGPNPSE